MHSRPALACALLTWLLAAPVSAQQIKPYFLVILDTSGSMGWCSKGQTNYECRSGNTSGGAFLPNTCGLPSNRLGNAKCALQRIIDSTGDATFGLMEFKHACNASCTDDLTTDSSTQCDAELLETIQDNNASSMRQWVDGVCSNAGGVAGTASCTNDVPRELRASGLTPIAKSLSRAEEYLRGSVTVGNTWPYPTNPDGANKATASPVANGPQLACQPVSVILLTDGADTCAGSPTNDPPAAAAALFAGNLKATTRAAKAYKTYVIGYGSGSADPNGYDPTVLDNVAIQGGTDSHDPAGHYYPASNEAQLSAALSQIIADAQPPVEICNGLDDDCDTKIDEGIPKFCDKPHGVTDPLTCAGAPDPPGLVFCCDEHDETLCDGEDDDCDGIIDEGVLNACGQCGKVPKEICDGEDNDCDGSIDEDTDGKACGTDVGACKKGMLRCVGGKEQCLGGIGPTDETCDCKDNDCDGSVDEDVDNSLCKDGKCIGCECVDLCTPGEEFMPECPDNKRPDVQPSGECLCIVDNCDARACNGMTIKHDDEVACAPNQEEVGTCSCSAGMCVARCDGVSCASDEICDKRDGRCVENNCRGLGCEDGELCDPLTLECTADVCAKTKCDDSEVCRDGKCEKSCAKVSCEVGQRCASGRCEKDLCATTMCGPNEVCDSSSGHCKKNPCMTKPCDRGLICSFDSGDCVRDQCFDVRCPKGQTCAEGECSVPGTIGGTAHPSTGGSDPNQRVLAAGGGGCSCRVAVGAAPGATHSGWAALLLALGLGAVRMRRRRLRARWLALSLLAGAMLFALAGCSVKPFCIDCADAGANGSSGSSGNGSSGTGSQRDAQVEGDGAVFEDGGGGDGGTSHGDGGLLATCTDPQPETCDGKDEDCDFKVDEDVPEAEVNDCNQNGVCADSHKICAGGKFVCRYPDTREDDETKCDGIDNDCDGRVDETFKELGKDCQVGIGACQVTGKQVCNKGGNGVTCKIDKMIDPKDEICDGIDNDCDGDIDEPASAPGSAPSFVHDDVVEFATGKWIYRYEASRADATSKQIGVIGSRACSRGGVQPWTNLTYDEAKAACAAADMALCAVVDWQNACEGMNNCAWSFNNGSSCASSYPTDASPDNKKACNGHDLAAHAGDPDDDALDVTGAYEDCYSAVKDDEKVYDMSGNAKEWTIGPDSELSAKQSPLRGGSYNNLPAGLRCDFNFALAGNDVRLPNVGFRCCSSKDPAQP